MAKLFDRVKVNIATTGDEDIVFGAASSNAFLTPAEAGATDGDTVRYVLVDGTDFEIGIGTIYGSVSTMNRTTVTRSKIGGTVGTSKINLSGTAVLALTAAAADILNPVNNLSDLANADTALTNLGGTTVGKALFTAADAAAVSTAIGTVKAVRIQKFTASDTYTPDPNLLYAVIECVGGGGGGGGVTGATGATIGGGGGGAGSYAKKIASATDIGASQTVTVGAAGTPGGSTGTAGSGGDTSVGSLCIGKGGTGGTAGIGAGTIGQGGAGGGAGTGDVTVVGQKGGAGNYTTTTTVGATAGAGGSSYFSGGAFPPAFGFTAATAGSAATGYGGGGSGGGAHNITSTNGGGAGAPGYVIITEFCSQ